QVVDVGVAEGVAGAADGGGQSAHVVVAGQGDGPDTADPQVGHGERARAADRTAGNQRQVSSAAGRDGGAHGHIAAVGVADGQPVGGHLVELGAGQAQGAGGVGAAEVDRLAIGVLHQRNVAGAGVDGGVQAHVVGAQRDVGAAGGDGAV